jgi:hypothetical protein
VSDTENKSYNFQIGSRVRIRGMRDVFTVSKYWDGRDDVLIDSPNGRLVSVDYRGLEPVDDWCEQERMKKLELRLKNLAEEFELKAEVAKRGSGYYNYTYRGLQELAKIARGL